MHKVQSGRGIKAGTAVGVSGHERVIAMVAISIAVGAAGVVADVVEKRGGGSNGSRLRLWKRELQRLADELGIEITVHHLPPGTSKWNKIEHRLFSFISQNWRAKPLVSYRVIVDLISATTTATGLTVRCELDTNAYPKGITVSDAEMATINLSRANFQGEWNYTIRPRHSQDQAVNP